MSDGHCLELLHSHSTVIIQPDFDDQRYRGINPYALGFAMMEDIERICREPTEEDREWFPDFAGCGDPMPVLRRRLGRITATRASSCNSSARI